MKSNDIQIIAILLGFVVNLVGTYLTSGLLILVYFNAKGISLDNSKDVIYSDNFILSLLIFSGLAWSMLGGYICARTAKKSHYFNAATIGIIGIAMSSYSYVMGDPSPSWYKTIALTCEIPITLLGVKLAMAKNSGHQ
ncbi:hypothetical protein [Paenibacillus hamazuiensis]|uniref:hypothetical protein n=1 Tax=Paenibacillus hamazuiensis TaxID=2936508 RepID=UPI00200E6182|nr:hypothetical protein [Paenibacillus hamazuiensis]